MSTLTLEEQASPSTPSANKVVVYPKSDGLLYSKDDTGLELPVNGVSSMTSSLAADVNLSTVAQYFDGPSVAQGTSGTWFASGVVVLAAGASANGFYVKLWDGTTVMASCAIQASPGGAYTTTTLSGVLANPAGNIRISARDITATDGKLLFNQTSTSKDCTITAIRIT
jgi:hypothetical protein